LPRPVVRNNSTATGSSNKSRNFTHPVIFLSLKRLYPIAARDYKISDFDYLKQHKQDFIGFTNELLNRSSSHATGTDGTISSAVAHGANYDQESVSAGEDNAGQIILALMSFRKLKEEYPDYRGGLLLIDEADAGLFPTAQVNLLRMLERECKSLNLQVIMTSHSPAIIEYAFEQSQDQHKKYKYKTVYLSDSRGKVQVMHDWSWSKIYADINSKPPPTLSSASLPKINVYFEDNEAEEFFNALMIGQPLKKTIRTMSGVTLGCDNFKHLIDHKVPEFSETSVICLDADAAQKLKRKPYKTIVLLPGSLPPDQLIFEHLYNLPADDSFWTDDFDRPVFTNCAGTANAIREMQISEEKIDLKKKVAAYTKNNNLKARDIFKGFYKDKALQQIFALKSKQHNPWKHWIKNNPEPVNAFLENFKSAIQGVMKDGYAVEPAKLAALEVKLKRV
jgi:hypothetical protein